MDPPDIYEPLDPPNIKVTRRFLGCRALFDDLAWAVEESHVMIIDLCPCLRRATVAEPQRAAFVRYNPFYWALLVIAVASILLGRWTHAIFGQGGPVREDELSIERQVRVQWIYAK